MIKGEKKDDLGLTKRNGTLLTPDTISLIAKAKFNINLTKDEVQEEEDSDIESSSEDSEKSNYNVKSKNSVKEDIKEKPQNDEKKEEGELIPSKNGMNNLKGLLEKIKIKKKKGIPIPPYLLFLSKILPKSRYSHPNFENQTIEDFFQKKPNYEKFKEIAESLSKIPFFNHIQSKILTRNLKLKEIPGKLKTLKPTPNPLPKAIPLEFQKGNPLYESAKILRTRDFKEGEKIFNYRAASKEFYIVLEGKVGIFVERTHEEISKDRNAVYWAKNRIAFFRNSVEHLMNFAGIGEHIYGIDNLAMNVNDGTWDQKDRIVYQHLVGKLTYYQIMRMRDVEKLFEKLLKKIKVKGKKKFSLTFFKNAFMGGENQDNKEDLGSGFKEKKEKKIQKKFDRSKGTVLLLYGKLRNMIEEYLNLQWTLENGFNNNFVNNECDISEGIWALFLMGLGLKGKNNYIKFFKLSRKWGKRAFLLQDFNEI